MTSTPTVSAELAHLLLEATVALAAGQFARAWALTQQALDAAQCSNQGVDGRELARRLSELLAVVDETLRISFGEQWSNLIGVESEILPNKTDLRCSFCSKGLAEGVKLLAGPRFFVCSDCLALCREILDGRHPLDQMP